MCRGGATFLCREQRYGYDPAESDEGEAHSQTVERVGDTRWGLFTYTFTFNLTFAF